jgi:ABC-type Fe3+/spermidine/putrescine transport system ATPase subunit
VAGFLGASNLLPGAIEGPDAIRLDDGTVVRAAVDGRSGRVAAGVRPEKITIGAGGGANELAGTVAETAYIGVATQVVVRTAVGTVQVFAQNMDAGGRVPSPGTTVVLSWSPESTFVVDRDESPSEEEHE